MAVSERDAGLLKAVGSTLKSPQPGDVEVLRLVGKKLRELQEQIRDESSRAISEVLRSLKPQDLSPLVEAIELLAEESKPPAVNVKVVVEALEAVADAVESNTDALKEIAVLLGDRKKRKIVIKHGDKESVISTEES